MTSTSLSSLSKDPAENLFCPVGTLIYLYKEEVKVQFQAAGWSLAYRNLDSLNQVLHTKLVFSQRLLSNTAGEIQLIIDNRSQLQREDVHSRSS